MSRYQQFDALGKQLYEALRENIRKHGILDPIEIDDDTGEILDGNNRAAIAKELGIECPTVRRKFATEAAKIEFALMRNLMRRQLSAAEWGEKFLALCELKGVNLGKPLVGRPKKATGDSKNGDLKLRQSVAAISEPSIKQVAKDVGVSERTARHRVAAAKAAKAPPPPPPAPKPKPGHALPEGQLVYDHVQAAFDKAVDIDNVIKHLRAVRKEFSALTADEHLGPHVIQHQQRFEIIIKEAEGIMKWVRPFADCPVCAQHGCAKNQVCYGTGWLTKNKFEALPADVRRRSKVVEFKE